jgi:hypothetical protein
MFYKSHLSLGLLQIFVGIVSCIRDDGAHILFSIVFITTLVIGVINAMLSCACCAIEHDSDDMVAWPDTDCVDPLVASNGNVHGKKDDGFSDSADGNLNSNLDMSMYANQLDNLLNFDKIDDNVKDYKNTSFGYGSVCDFLPSDHHLIEDVSSLPIARVPQTAHSVPADASMAYLASESITLDAVD